PNTPGTRMFGYSPTRIRGTADAMDALDAWAGSPAFVSAPFTEPSLELGTPAGWAPGPASEGLLGEIDVAATPAAVRLARSYVRELVGEFFGAGAAVLDD